MKRNRLYGAMNRGLYERKSDNEGGGGAGDLGADVVKEIKTLIEGIQKKFTDYKAANEERLKIIEKGGSTTDIETKLAKIEKDLGDDTEKREGLEKSFAAFQKSVLGGPGAGMSAKEKAEFDLDVKMFNLARKSGTNGASVVDLTGEQYPHAKSGTEKFLRKGTAAQFTPEEQKAMTAGDDPNGGFFLPPPAVGRIVERLFELSPMRDLATVQSISGSALEGINDNDEAAAGWVGETDARPDTATPQIGKYRIEAFEMYAQPAVTQTLLDDAAVDVEAWLAGKVAAKFARLEDLAFVSGNGVNQPKGFTTYPMSTADDNTRAWGTIQFIKTGTNASFGTNADVLFDLIAAFRPPYLQNARFLTRREVVAALRKLKGAVAGDYLWQPGLQQGQPDKLLGYPMATEQNLPALATNGYSMWFGDWKEFYTIVDRIGIRVLRDPYTNKPYIKFYTTKRVGGGVLNYEAMKAVQFSA